MIQKNKSKRGWRFRVLIAGLALFALYLCFGVWAVPSILISQVQTAGSEALGRKLTIGRATFNPLTLEAKLFDITVGGADGEKGDLLKLGKASANPQVSSIFGTITLKSVEIHDGDLWIEKSDSGRLSFQDILDGFDAAPVAEDAKPTELPQAIVKRFTIGNFTAHFTDSSLASPYIETITVAAFNGRDIGTVAKSESSLKAEGAKPYHWDFDGLVDTGSGAEIKIEGGATSIVPWAFAVDASLAGFQLASVQAYIDESVVARIGGIFGGDLHAQIALKEGGAEILARGNVGIDSVSVEDSEQTFARFESLRVSGIEADLTTMNVAIQSIALQKPYASGILQQDGSPRLPEFKTVESMPQSEGSAAQALHAAIASFTISQGEVDFEDQGIATPFKTKIDAIELALSDLKVASEGDQLDASAAMTLSLNILGGTVHLDSKLESLDGLATAEIKVDGLQLAQVQPYVSEYANAKVKEGALSLSLSAQLDKLASPSAKGTVELIGLKIDEPDSDHELMTMSRFSLAGIDFHDDSVNFDSIQIVEPLLTVWQNEEGANLSRIAKIEQQTTAAVEEVEATTGLSIYIKKFELVSAGVAFSDTTLLSTQKSKVSNYNFTAENISTDPEQLARFTFDGTIDSSARLEGSGTANTMDPAQYLDLDMVFRGYDLTATSPYWETYLGRALAKGQFEIRSRYKVRDNQLDGTNDFKIDQLTLGQKVQSDRAINLPIGFAIKLMQDPSGMISFDGLAVKGDLADPEVRPMGLIGIAIRNLIMKAVTSPFKFLAGMVGGREDLDTVEFALGSVELGPDAPEKIEALKKMMSMRPGITLEVGFNEDPQERELLETRYAQLLLLNPDLEVVSGLDLLKPIDQAALEAKVQAEFATIERSSDSAVTQPVEANSATEVANNPSKSNDVGLVKRIAATLGLAKKSQGSVSQETTVTEQASEDSKADNSTAEQVESPSFEVMLAEVLASRTPAVFEARWLKDLADQRVQVFKAALLADGTIDTSRIFATELTAENRNGAKKGALLIKLSD